MYKIDYNIILSTFTFLLSKFLKHYFLDVQNLICLATAYLMELNNPADNNPLIACVIELIIIVRLIILVKFAASGHQ